MENYHHQDGRDTRHFIKHMGKEREGERQEGEDEGHRRVEQGEEAGLQSTRWPGFSEGFEIIIWTGRRGVGNQIILCRWRKMVSHLCQVAGSDI